MSIEIVKFDSKMLGVLKIKRFIYIYNQPPEEREKKCFKRRKRLCFKSQQMTNNFYEKVYKSLRKKNNND